MHRWLPSHKKTADYSSAAVLSLFRRAVSLIMSSVFASTAVSKKSSSSGRLQIAFAISAACLDMDYDDAIRAEAARAIDAKEEEECYRHFAVDTVVSELAKAPVYTYFYTLKLPADEMPGSPNRRMKCDFMSLNEPLKPVKRQQKPSLQVPVQQASASNNIARSNNFYISDYARKQSHALPKGDDIAPRIFIFLSVHCLPVDIYSE